MTSIAVLILAASFSAEPQLSDVAWLAGSWRGNLHGGKIEEVWTPQQGGVMMGMFRMLNPKGQANLYEFQIIEETAEGVHLRIKHFNRALKGQEEREKFVDFKLTQASAHQATFEATEEDARVTLIYKRHDDGHLEIEFLKVITSTGKEQKMLFPFERVP